MKRYVLICLVLIAAFVGSCNTYESDVERNGKTDDLQDTGDDSDNKSDTAGDEFNGLSVDSAFFAADGGSLTVAATHDILFHMVRLRIDGEASYRTVFEGQGLDIDSRPPSFPAVFELEDCLVTMSNARTMVILLFPSDMKRVIRLTVSGIKDDGTFLSPRDIVLYQNY